MQYLFPDGHEHTWWCNQSLAFFNSDPPVFLELINWLLTCKFAEDKCSWDQLNISVCGAAFLCLAWGLAATHCCDPGNIDSHESLKYMIMKTQHHYFTHCYQPYNTELEAQPQTLQSCPRQETQVLSLQFFWDPLERTWKRWPNPPKISRYKKVSHTIPTNKIVCVCVRINFWWTGLSQTAFTLQRWSLEVLIKVNIA